jgi:hypothetical protein
MKVKLSRSLTNLSHSGPAQAVTFNFLKSGDPLPPQAAGALAPNAVAEVQRE